MRKFSSLIMSHTSMPDSPVSMVLVNKLITDFLFRVFLVLLKMQRTCVLLEEAHCKILGLLSFF